MDSRKLLDMVDTLLLDERSRSRQLSFKVEMSEPRWNMMCLRVSLPFFPGTLLRKDMIVKEILTPMRRE